MILIQISNTYIKKYEVHTYKLRHFQKIIAYNWEDCKEFMLKYWRGKKYGQPVKRKYIYIYIYKIYL